MAGLRVEQFVVGPVMTNCYFAVQTDTAEALDWKAEGTRVFCGRCSAHARAF